MSEVKTAGGKCHQIIRKIRILVSYNDKKYEIDFYLCPDLMQEVYLRINFWIIFGIAPKIFENEEINPEVLKEKYPLDLDKVRICELSKEQQKELERVKSLFYTYEENGLGRTNLEKHQIDLIEGTMPVKERYYPVSPAVQELIYAEIDEMLRLGVIEESQSPWSNRCTLVRKPAKNRLCLDDIMKER